MNNLKVDLLGGMRLESEDWIFNQNGIKQAIEGLGSMIDRNVHLSGITSVVYGGGNVTYNAGFVMIEGEVFYVPAASVTDNGFLIYAEIEETNDPAGLEVFEDGGSPQNTYLTRTAKLVTYATSQTETATRKLFATMLSLDEKVIEAIQANANVFTARQSWQQGAAVAVSAGSTAISFSYGNAYDVNIDDATVPLTRLSGSMNNGTWLALHFTGTAGVEAIIGDGIGLSNGFDCGGESYRFKVGESAIFVVKSGKYRLTNRGFAATIAQVEAGFVNDRVVTPANLAGAITDILDTNFTVVGAEGGTGKIRFKRIDIGNWNMDTLDILSIAHGIAVPHNIIGVTVVIRNDADNSFVDLTFPQNNTGSDFPQTEGAISWNNTVVNLRRRTTGIFDSTDYDSTSYNRGKMTVIYEA